MAEFAEGVEQQKQIPKKPEFDGGSFTIEYLSTSLAGFEVKTRESLLRHEPNTPLPEAERIRVERGREPKKFRLGPQFTPKAGIRNIQRIGNELIFDIKPVTFPTYKAISDPLETEKALEISNPSATALILLTSEKDGSHRILLQHRSEQNFFYGDVPGASVAGYLDGKLDRRRENRGRLIAIDTDYVVQNIKKEMNEEVGVEPNELKECRITGFAKDKIRIHDEFLLLGISTLSSDEIAKMVGRGDEHMFGEKFFLIDGTPETIDTLLTKVKCPLPHTHVAAFVAAGFSLILEKEGLEIANSWKDKVEKGVKSNYQEIDRMVAQYYKDHPEIPNQRSEGKPPRNPHGYEPAYLPQQQGLPDVNSELRRVGLISD